jgi:hypothetical protein
VSLSFAHVSEQCANVFVNREGNCAIADFGQSELKDDAYRLSGRQRPSMLTLEVNALFLTTWLHRWDAQVESTRSFGRCCKSDNAG